MHNAWRTEGFDAQILLREKMKEVFIHEENKEQDA